MVVVNLRGTGGSGKSYVGHHLVDHYCEEELYEDGWSKRGHKLIGYRCRGDLIVVGPYRAPGGGADLLGAADRSLIATLVERKAREHAHVFFEALVVSSSIPGYLALGERLAGTQEIVFPFMDTPIEVCIASILHRNGGRPINERGVADHRRFCLTRGKPRLEAAGYRCPMIRREHSTEDVEAVLREAGWNPD